MYKLAGFDLEFKRLRAAFAVPIFDSSQVGFAACICDSFFKRSDGASFHNLSLLQHMQSIGI